MAPSSRLLLAGFQSFTVRFVKPAAAQALRDSVLELARGPPNQLPFQCADKQVQNALYVLTCVVSLRFFNTKGSGYVSIFDQCGLYCFCVRFIFA